MIDLTFAFQRVVNALDRVGARYVIVGSAAAAAWGVVRSTRDIDLVAMVSRESVETLLNELSVEDLYLPVDEARRAATEGGSFNVLHPATGGKVDIFICKPDDPFEHMRLGRRVRLPILGVTSWVATPEDVILSKLNWRITSRSDTQWRDCIEIAATQPLDVDHLRFWADHLGVIADLEDLLDESGMAS